MAGTFLGTRETSAFFVVLEQVAGLLNFPAPPLSVQCYNKDRTVAACGLNKLPPWTE